MSDLSKSRLDVSFHACFKGVLKVFVFLDFSINVFDELVFVSGAVFLNAFNPPGKALINSINVGFDFFGDFFCEILQIGQVESLRPSSENNWWYS